MYKGYKRVGEYDTIKCPEIIYWVKDKQYVCGCLGLLLESNTDVCEKCKGLINPDNKEVK